MTFEILKESTIETHVLKFLEKHKDTAVTRAEVVNYCMLHIDFTSDGAAKSAINTILQEFQTAKKAKNIERGYWGYCKNKKEFDAMPVFG